ncbi:hypothetical protein D8Y20_11625 [Mariprofundus sp. EBB-1]|nr:hypothetical protein D8Y20_11625 [Mariprofundus sp. EBB-1]
MLMEKIKENSWVFLILFSLIASYTAYNFIPASTQHVEGIVIAATSPNSGIFTIQLADDHRIQLDIPVLKPGTHVELQEKTTFLFNVQSYQFIKVIE